MDVYGHVNNARFLTLYEEARVAMMFTGAREAGVTSLEDGVVISRHEVDYLRPVDYGADVRIEMWLEEIRAVASWSGTSCSTTTWWRAGHDRCAYLLTWLRGGRAG
jgi:acyl-CoA thioesterase FadM